MTTEREQTQRACARAHSDGRSRQIAFIGFKTAAQAQDAVRYFNRTFMDTSRLDVTVRSFARSQPPPCTWRVR